VCSDERNPRPHTPKSAIAALVDSCKTCKDQVWGAIRTRPSPGSPLLRLCDTTACTTRDPEPERESDLLKGGRARLLP
jgi:hypothetical protein